MRRGRIVLCGLLALYALIVLPLSIWMGNIIGITSGVSALYLSFVVWPPKPKVVAEPGNVPGTFTITIEGKTTKPIPHNATIPELKQAAQDAGIDNVELLEAWPW